MYLEPAKTASFASATLPATGTPTVDLLDMSGYGTGVRPGAQGPKSLAGSNPSYNNGASRKERYYSFDGGDVFYKDYASNANGGLSQFNVTSGTVHVWIRPTTSTISGTQILFDMDGRFQMGVGTSNGSTRDRITFGSTSMGDFSLPTYTMSANQWIMISIAFNPSGNVTAYANGGSQSLSPTAAQTIPALDGYTYLTIGASSGFGGFFAGHIGPVLFYNKKQSGAEILRVFNYFTTTYNA